MEKLPGIAERKNFPYTPDTLKSYRDALALYVVFLEGKGITHDSLGRRCFERDSIEGWIIWLKDVRRCSPETCNIRLGSLRAFLEFVGSKDVRFMYLYREAKLIKHQKRRKKKMEGSSNSHTCTLMRQNPMGNRLCNEIGV